MTTSLSSASITYLVLESLQEIVGKEMTERIIQKAFSLQFPRNAEIKNERAIMPGWDQICMAGESIYGLRGCQGLTLRTGRIFFKELLRLHGDEIGIGDIPLRMLPKPKRIRTGIAKLAESFSPLVNFYWQIEEDERFWSIHMSNQSTQNESSEHPPAMLFLGIGMLQEFLAWVSGGKVYPIYHEWDKNQNTWRIVISKQYIS